MKTKTTPIVAAAIMVLSLACKAEHDQPVDPAAEQLAIEQNERLQRVKFLLGNHYAHPDSAQEIRESSHDRKVYAYMSKAYRLRELAKEALVDIYPFVNEICEAKSRICDKDASFHTILAINAWIDLANELEGLVKFRHMERNGSMNPGKDFESGGYQYSCVNADSTILYTIYFDEDVSKILYIEGYDCSKFDEDDRYIYPTPK